MKRMPHSAKNPPAGPLAEAFYQAHRRLAEMLEHQAVWPIHEPRQAERAIDTSYVKKKEIPRLKEEELANADTFAQRDRLCRQLAQECYNEAQQMWRLKSHKGYERWMKLAHKYIDLSFKPKRLEELEQIRRALAEVKQRQQQVEP